MFIEGSYRNEVEDERIGRYTLTINTDHIISYKYDNKWSEDFAEMTRRWSENRYSYVITMSNGDELTLFFEKKLEDILNVKRVIAEQIPK